MDMKAADAAGAITGITRAVSASNPMISSGSILSFASPARSVRLVCSSDHTYTLRVD